MGDYVGLMELFAKDLFIQGDDERTALRRHLGIDCYPFKAIYEFEARPRRLAQFLVGCSLWL
jgi:hypothetical protein